MADEDPRSDEELLAATPADPDAFAAFYRRYVQMVLAVVARRAEPSDVGDLVAEVFATALVHRRRFDPSRGRGGAWLTGIAYNKLADAARRGAVEARVLHDKSYRQIAKEEAASEQAVRKRVSRALRALRSRFLEEP